MTLKCKCTKPSRIINKITKLGGKVIIKIKIKNKVLCKKYSQVEISQLNNNPQVNFNNNQ